MAIFKDDLGREVIIDEMPKRIISLVPSQTELLYHLHLNAEVVGITKFCVHPTEWFRSKTRIGGTKNVDIPKIKSLQPDLIIANKEENVQEQVMNLAKTSIIQRAWSQDKRPDLHGWVYSIKDGVLKPVYEVKAGTHIDPIYEFDGLLPSK